MRALLSTLLLLLALNAQAVGLADLSNQDAVSGLKEALSKGADHAVGTLGKTDGFLANDAVRIPLPPNLQTIDGLLRRVGMGKQADELIVTMNRAAEAAVPEAKALLLQAVKDMSVQDAKGILTGSNTAATEYFRGKTSAPLTQKFLPIVQRATAKVGVAQKYDQFAGKAAGLGLLDAKQANLESYITQKTLDGLFVMMAEEEKAIRKDPVGQTSKLLSTVFGAIGH